MNNNLDIYLFHRGEHRKAYGYLGAHPNRTGTIFRVWAPNAKSVSVVGDFNNWNSETNIMNKLNNEGLWEVEIKKLKKETLYKFSIENYNGTFNLKADPYAFYSEERPNTASIIHGVPKFPWADKRWLKSRNINENLNLPVNIYEVHLGSWKKTEDNTFLNYREIAHKLAEYVKFMNYTHIELLPINEYPLDASWGYQITGYYSVTSRFGTPEDFMYFINHMHKEKIGVILDWVPGHFCKDAHGLYQFDGKPLYEHSDSRLGENSQWGTCNFDFSRNEVLSFLNSNALYWFREFHIDGIRIDAVANILYSSFGKNEDFNLKNIYGGDENLEGVTFLKSLNYIIREEFPNIMTFAEDSTTWPLVTTPVSQGGLGFSFKWSMGWMNDTLKYIKQDPFYRVNQHNLLTFSFMYSFSENYILAISHDEVVHGKCSMLNKMPGSIDEKFKNLRLYNAFMMAHPGKKLNFMGNELAQGLEWRFYDSLEWNLLSFERNKSFHTYIQSLNDFYLKNSSFWELDSDRLGFKWGNSSPEENTLSFLRKGTDNDNFIVVVFNFANIERKNHRLGVPIAGTYLEVFNTEGSLIFNNDELTSENISINEMRYSLNINIPALAALFFKIKK
ncbi:MAG: 1,4-alpha-glucan branching protein GlgB [Fusobacteriaceae bacterium]